MIAWGFRARIASGEIVWPTSSEYTRHSRTRRAISCAYWPPKSRTSTGRSSATGNSTTFDDGSATIVRRLFRDRHVVRMRLAETGARDAHKAGALHLVDGRRAAVAHRLTQTADQLVENRRDRALVRHASFDALRHELLDVFHVALEVPVLRERPGAHRPDRAHAAVLLVALALIDDHLAGRLVGAGEHRPRHDRVRARGDRLRDVARRGDAAVGDHRHVHHLRDVVDRGHLRDAAPRDDASRASGAGALPDLPPVCARRDERLAAFRRGDVARDHVDLDARL